MRFTAKKIELEKYMFIYDEIVVRPLRFVVYMHSELR